MLYFADMRLRYQTAKLIVFFCLLMLQMQVWASVSLPCLHTSSNPGADVSGCPMHGFGDSSLGAESRSNLYDCHRCIIGSCLGVVHGAQVSPAPFRVLRQVDVADVPPKHFYHFSPKTVFRPPIFHSC